MFAFAFFASTLVIILACQAIWPRRRFPLEWHQRWPGAFALLVIGTLLSRLALPIGLIGVALIAQANSIGLLNQIDLPIWLHIAVGLICLDFAIWLQHVAMHRYEPLWRFHRVHHTDTGFDVTTALRFHPLEFLFSLGWKAAVILLLGPSPETVAAFAIILNAAAMFNHANLAIPPSVDRWLRWLIVTPDMHRVHHSTNHREANSNFGFCLPWWDRLFRVYLEQPSTPHEDMLLGNEKWRSSESNSTLSLLKQPFD